MDPELILSSAFTRPVGSLLPAPLLALKRQVGVIVTGLVATGYHLDWVEGEEVGDIDNSTGQQNATDSYTGGGGGNPDTADNQQVPGGKR